MQVNVGSSCSGQLSSVYSDSFHNQCKFKRALQQVLHVWANDFEACVQDGRAFVYIDTGAGLTCVGNCELEMLREVYRKQGIKLKNEVTCTQHQWGWGKC